MYDIWTVILFYGSMKPWGYHFSEEYQEECQVKARSEKEALARGQQCLGPVQLEFGMTMIALQD
jgi:hypothetical protein